MSVVPRHPEVSAPSGARLSADQFLDLGEHEVRMELIEGVVVVSPSARPVHQLILDALQEQPAMLRRAGIEIVVFPDTDVRFDDRTVFHPDVSIYSRGRVAGIPERLTLPPDIVIEVVSPASKVLDLITKREEYERFGVREYVAIDSQTGRTTHWALKGQVFHEVAVEGEIASVAVPGVRIDLEPIRALIQAATRTP